MCGFYLVYQGVEILYVCFIWCLKALRYCMCCFYLVSQGVEILYEWFYLVSQCVEILYVCFLSSVSMGSSRAQATNHT